MDINTALTNTLLNNMSRNSILLNNLDSLIFIISQFKSDPDLDLNHLQPLIENLYSDYFYYDLSSIRDEQKFVEKYNYIIEQYQSFFDKPLIEQSCYDECINKLFSYNSDIERDFIQKFIVEKINFDNISDNTKQKIGINLIEKNIYKIIDNLLERKILDVGFIHKNKDNDPELIPPNKRNSSLNLIANSHMMEVFIKNGLNLNNEDKLSFIIGINAIENKVLNNILKSELSDEKYEINKNRVYEYENRRFVENLKKIFSLKNPPTDSEYKKKTGFRDFWTLKVNNENIFYNVMRISGKDNFDKNSTVHLVEKIVNDSDNFKKYQKMYAEKNKFGLNMLEFLIQSYSKRNENRCEINEEWMFSLTKVCSINPDNDISLGIRESVLSSHLMAEIFKIIKQDNNKQDIFNIFFGRDSKVFENEVMNKIYSMTRNNDIKSDDRKLLLQLELLGIDNAELFKDKYISGAVYLYLSCLQEKGVELSKEHVEFYQQLKFSKPLLHKYEHRHESLKVYIAELEKNHLLNIDETQENLQNKKIRRL